MASFSTSYKTAIEISVKPEQFRELERDLGHIAGGVQRAARIAVNKAGKKSHTRVIRGLASLLNLKQKYLRDVIRFVPATAETMTAKVRLSKVPIPLIDFPGVRPSRRGIVVKTRKGRPSELLRGTFLATMKSGHQGVFERRSRTGKKTRRVVILRNGKFHNTSELPIEERFGPTPAGVFENAPGVVATETAAANEDLEKQLASAVDFLLDRKKVPETEQE